MPARTDLHTIRGYDLTVGDVLADGTHLTQVLYDPAVDDHVTAFDNTGVRRTFGWDEHVHIFDEAAVAATGHAADEAAGWNTSTVELDDGTIADLAPLDLHDAAIAAIHDALSLVETLASTPDALDTDGHGDERARFLIAGLRAAASLLADRAPAAAAA